MEYRLVVSSSTPVLSIHRFAPQIQDEFGRLLAITPSQTPTSKAHLAH